MRFIVGKGKFVGTLLAIILSGSLFTRVVFADDEPKIVPAGDERFKQPCWSRLQRFTRPL